MESNKKITIELPLTKKNGVIVVIAILLLGVGWIGNTHGPLYLNNQWKPHRWASDVCRAQGLDPANCEVSIWRVDPKISKEVPVFDVCLEHGELKRVR